MYFTPMHFELFTVSGCHCSGICHKEFLGGLTEGVTSKCMLGFLNIYQIVGDDRNVPANTNFIPKEWNECIVFMSE